MRTRAATDKNHKEITNAFRAEGFSVKSTHQLKGFCDCVIGKYGKNFLIEIKDISKRSAARKSATPLKLLRTMYAHLTARLTESRARLMSPVQLEWADTWAGSPVHCVTSAQEFAAVLGLCLRCGILDDDGLCIRCRG